MTIMQRLLWVIVLSFAAKSFAQTNVPTENNTKGNTNNIYLNSNASGNSVIIIDSVNTYKYIVPATVNEIQEKEISTKSKKTEDKKATSKSPAVKMEAVPQTTSEDLNMELKDAEKADSPVIESAGKMQQQFEIYQNSSNSQYTRRSASYEEQQNMDASVGYYNQVLPNSFESHFYTYLAGHYNTDLYQALQAAAALEPTNLEVKKQQAAYHIITKETDLALPKIQELIEANVVSAGQLTYANDLLLSSDQSAILIMHGFEDMFAAYYVQQTDSVREDVQLLSLDFMQSERYRSNWEENDLLLPESTTIDTAYLADLCQLNPDRLLQLSLTIPKDYFVPIKNNLYPVGLTFRYDVTPIDNFSANYTLWKERLSFQLVNESSNDSGDKWCTNYLPMLVSLRKQLVLQGNKTEEELVNKLILKIGEKTKNPERVKKYIGK